MACDRNKRELDILCRVQTEGRRPQKARNQAKCLPAPPRLVPLASSCMRGRGRGSVWFNFHKQLGPD